MRIIIGTIIIADIFTLGAVIKTNIPSARRADKYLQVAMLSLLLTDIIFRKKLMIEAT